MNNTLNDKFLKAEDGGSIPVEVMASAEFNGMKLVEPFRSIGFSQEGDSPAIGQCFDFHGQKFVVVKVGASKRDINFQTFKVQGPDRSTFTAMAVANA